MKDYALRLERSPITGKVEIVKPDSLFVPPDRLVWLVFAEGLAAWNLLEESEKLSIADLIYSTWKYAIQSKEMVAARFLGNILINLHTNKSPVHGEYHD